MKSFLILSALSIFSFILFSCKKNNNTNINNCLDVKPIQANAFIGEMIGDSTFATDTAFTGTVLFETKGNYKQFHWKIGYDTSTFNSKKFTLRFEYPLPAINVNLFVSNNPNAQCFPNDDGMDTAINSLTILPRDSTAKSPLIGDYLGYIEGRQSDTFTVRINFWNDKKYNPVLGPQPFYTISNFPKGYRDTTSSIGTRFKELSYGYVCDWGYRALFIYEDYLQAQQVKGYAYLSNRNSLIIDYSRSDVSAPYDPQTGYPRLKEKFIGIRK